MKYFLIAGEASGDLHASNLMNELKAADPSAVFCFFGGELMQAAGGLPPVKHYREMAYMGVLPVLLHARTILKNMQLCRDAILGFQPDVVILVDYPGFNLRIAKFVKTKCPTVRVHYYISPKIWAWKKYRIRTIRRYVDRMLCIFPFEREFYAGLNYSVDYVGNPVVDAVEKYREEHQNADNFLKDNKLTSKPILALLAGSRRQEIKDNLSAMLDVAAAFSEYQYVIAGAPGLEPSDYQKYIDGRNVSIVFGQTYALLAHSEIALVTSGTATLETALFRVPQVVCYYFAGGWMVNFIYRHFFQAPYISLVNLIGGREIVKELFGAKFSRRRIFRELTQLVDDAEYRRKMVDGYDEIIATLGRSGASRRAAQLIIADLTETKKHPLSSN
ncbi:MAG: lipid-A-disaccharide synthase [Tannerella sp.]|jgi:lipid-A-disaccharide synthase|nr:lipid-A-disaccharide synthase [Tannerella sp.]